MSREYRVLIQEKPAKVFPVIIQLYPEIANEKTETNQEIREEFFNLQQEYNIHEYQGTQNPGLPDHTNHAGIHALFQKIQSPGTWTRFHVVKYMNMKQFKLLIHGKFYELSEYENPHHEN